jgi:hypothetical protein
MIDHSTAREDLKKTAPTDTRSWIMAKLLSLKTCS